MKTLLILVLTVAAFGQQKVVGPINLDGAINGGTSAVGTDSYAITTSSEASLRVKAYVANQCFTFKADVANTGAASLAVDGLAATTIKKAEGGVTTDLADNEIRANQVVTACYDGTNMQMQSRSGVAASGDTTSVSNSGASGASVLKTGTNVTARKLVAGTNVTVTENTDDITIAASGGGSALTSNAGDAIWYPNGEPGTYSTATLTANTVYLEAFQTTVSMQFRNMWAYVTTAASSGKGMRGMIYTRASNGDITLVAKTAGILCDSTTTKVMAWSSGSLVSGGVLTLPAGQNYYVGLVSDGAPTIYSYNTNAGAGYLIRNGWNGSAFVAKIMASSTDGVTGTGVNVDVGASITNANINAGVDRRVLMLPLAP